MQPGAFNGVGSNCRRRARFACHSFFFALLVCCFELLVMFLRCFPVFSSFIFVCSPIFFVTVNIRPLPSHLFGGILRGASPFSIPPLPRPPPPVSSEEGRTSVAQFLESAFVFVDSLVSLFLWCCA